MKRLIIKDVEWAKDNDVELFDFHVTGWPFGRLQEDGMLLMVRGVSKDLQRYCSFMITKEKLNELFSYMED